MSLSPSLLHREADFALATFGDIFMTIWRDKTTMEGVRASRSAVEAFSAGRRREIGMLTIVEPGAPIPARAERTALADYLRAVSDSIKVSALVYEGEGFHAAAVRSLVTGLTLIARQDYPHRVFDSVDKAAVFMAPLLVQRDDSTPLAQEIIDAVAQLRRAVNQPT